MRVHTNKFCKYLILLTFFALITFTGCFGKKSETEIAQETSDIVMECIKNKNKDTIKSLFSPYVQKKYEIDNDIDKMFEIFDSPIDSEGQMYISSSSENNKDGKVIQSHISFVKEPVKLKDGRNYSIIFSMNIINPNKNLEGLMCVLVYTVDEQGMLGDKVCVIGTEEIIE